MCRLSVASGSPLDFISHGTPFEDIDYRAADSAAGYGARRGLRILHEGRNVGSTSKIIARLCIGCDGGGIGVVIADSSDGDGSRHRRDIELRIVTLLQHLSFYHS